MTKPVQPHATPRRKLEPKDLHAVLRYEPDTGRFFWRPRTTDTSSKRSRQLNGLLAGKEAFIGKDTMGYRSAGVLGRKFRAHRIAWAMTYGLWPTGEIDHVNGDQCDNRIVNLRQVDRQGNSRNCARSKRNTSGVTGVYWAASRGKWAAYIHVDRRIKALGRFVRKSDAVAARKEAEKLYGFHANHGRAAKPDFRARPNVSGEGQALPPRSSTAARQV